MRHRTPITTAVVLGIAGMGAGCGESVPAAPAVATDAPKATGFPAVSPAVRAAQRKLHDQVMAALHRPSAQRADGNLPAYLATHQGREQLLVGTTRHPAETTQGVPIRVRPASGAATALAIGPDIPRAIIGSGRRTAPATFTITFRHITGRLPLRNGVFGILDESGRLHVPAVSRTRHGDEVQVRLRATLVTGDGSLVYAPERRPMATWAYTLETD